MLSGGKGLLYDAPFKVFSLDGNRFGQFPSHTVPGSDLTRFQQMSIHSPEVCWSLRLNMSRCLGDLMGHKDGPWIFQPSLLVPREFQK
jgi:hypothetical protein